MISSEQPCYVGRLKFPWQGEGEQKIRPDRLTLLILLSSMDQAGGEGLVPPSPA